MKETVGFIGQGYIGKNYADDFEERGYTVVRYGLEEEYRSGKEKIKNCDVVFIAVPTPTKNGTSDDSAVREALSLMNEKSIAVIKSTLLPGTTERLQKDFTHLIVLHSPEFLSKATAKEDAQFPKRNIIGCSKDTDDHHKAAKKIITMLPKAPYELICTSRESEFLKYVNNSFYYVKLVYMNMLYDAAKAAGCDWNIMRDAIAAEPWIGDMHIDPVHKSGRGAGGLCLIKDYAAFSKWYKTVLEKDELGKEVIDAVKKKNLALLKNSSKDQDVVADVY